MGKKGKRTILLYALIVLNIGASALAVYGLLGQWKIQQESRDSYADLHQELAIHEGEATDAPQARADLYTPAPAGQTAEAVPRETASAAEGSISASAPPVQANVVSAPQGGVAGEGTQQAPAVATISPEEEEDAFLDSMEEEELDQDSTVWLIQVNQPQYLKFDATRPPAQSPPPEDNVLAAEGEQGAAVMAADAQSGGAVLSVPFAPYQDTAVQASGGDISTGTTAAPVLGEQPGAAPIVGLAAVTTPPYQETTVQTGEIGREGVTTDIEVVPVPAMPTPVPIAPGQPQSGELATVAPTAAPATAVPTVSPTPGPTAIATIAPWLERAVQVDSARYTMDLPFMKEKYEDMVAWLYQEGTKINYPVMQAEDNEYYLDRLYDGRRNKNGSLFLDCNASDNFIDANVYIYGHNVKTQDMFGSLINYKDQAYYNKHPEMTLLTEFSDFSIEIFACTMSLEEDETSWRVRQSKSKAEFDEFVDEIKEKSLFKSVVRPEWGDQILVLVTCTNISHGERYVVYGRMRPISYGTNETIGLTKINMDARETYSGKRIVGSLGSLQVYAQNDPLWKELRYETRDSKKKRTFGEGGNGPTAAAMVVANLVPEEELTRIRGYAANSTGFTFCPHSVNQYFCDNKHAQYPLVMPYEYLRYLPVAIANFTTGNNIWGETARLADKAGTSMSFLPYLAGMYGLELEANERQAVAIDALRQGGMVICVTGGRQSPFTTKSQYVVLAGADNEYLYILDPNRRTSYKATDTNRMLEVLSPGVVRVRLDYSRQIGLGTYYIFKRPPAEATVPQ